MEFTATLETDKIEMPEGFYLDFRSRRNEVYVFAFGREGRPVSGHLTFDGERRRVDVQCDESDGFVLKCFFLKVGIDGTFKLLSEHLKEVTKLVEEDGKRVKTAEGVVFKIVTPIPSPRSSYISVVDADGKDVAVVTDVCVDQFTGARLVRLSRGEWESFDLFYRRTA